MAIELTDPSFWSGQSSAQQLAQRFTSFYAERAWSIAAVPTGAKVLDIAAGAGPLAIVAARAGLPVLATDFSQGMVDAVLSYGIPNLEGSVMDGQSLDLPDASFDAAFSLFGIMLFPDWQAGLREMSRVLCPGGIGCVGTWKEPSGAAANLLLAKLCDALFPELKSSNPHGGLNELRDPDRFKAALLAVGFNDVSIVEVTTDFPIDLAAIAEPDRLFQFSPLWPQLDQSKRDAILASIRATLAARGGTLPVPSPALIGIATKR